MAYLKTKRIKYEDDLIIVYDYPMPGYLFDETRQRFKKYGKEEKWHDIREISDMQKLIEEEL